MASVTFDEATRLYPGGTRPAVDKLNLCLLYTSPSPRD